MDIHEAREAFERRQAKALNVPYEGLKAHFDENSRLFGARYNTGSINEKEWIVWLDAWQARAQAVPEGFVLVKQDHPDSIVHNQGLGLFKECQVIYGWNGKSKEFKDALNKGFYYGVKSGAKAVFETTVKPQESNNESD